MTGIKAQIWWRRWRESLSKQKSVFAHFRHQPPLVAWFGARCCSCDILIISELERSPCFCNFSVMLRTWHPKAAEVRTLMLYLPRFIATIPPPPPNCLLWEQRLSGSQLGPESCTPPTSCFLTLHSSPTVVSPPASITPSNTDALEGSTRTDWSQDWYE